MATYSDGKIRVLVVDDHPVMRKGIKMTLEADGSVECLQAGSAEEVLEHLEELNLDLALVDISLKGMNGLKLTRLLTARKPCLPVLVISRHDEGLYAERAIRAGAKGYVMKQEGVEVLLRAVHHVLEGGVYLSRSLNEKLLFGLAGGKSRPGSSPLELLSNRELEVFEMTGLGFSTRHIAEKLGLSVKTVESYRSRIKNKLNLRGATELLQHAVQWVEAEGRTEPARKA